MMPTPSVGLPGATVAFDRMADDYDATFTESRIGRAQRKVVWNAMQRAFRPGDYVLELNCGTGEDALFMARHGVSVLACDGSTRMIGVAERRKSREAPDSSIEFRVLRNEEVNTLTPAKQFDGVVSNFSGLNCVEDQSLVARKLTHLARPGATALICISTRVCLWEIAWYVAHGNLKKAFRRLGGATNTRLGDITVAVWYPTIVEIRRAFSPWFRLRSFRAVGLFVPPSYVESWVREHTFLLRWLETMDGTFAAWPILRVVGDHVLLEFERTG